MSNRDTRVRVSNAFRAMKNLGISDDKVKPVLKNLLKLYDKNWALIEEENYRALADAIFERQESEAEERSKKTMENAVAEQPKKMVDSVEKEDCLEKEAQANEGPERPLKRLRLKYRDGKSPSSDAPHSSAQGALLIRPKEEPTELPENTRVNDQAVPSQSLSKNKGKQPVSPTDTGRNQRNSAEPRSPSHPMRLRDRGKGSVSPKIPSNEKSSVPVSASNAVCLQEPKVAPANDMSSKRKSIATHALITPKDEPITDDMPHFEAPVPVMSPVPDNGGDSTCRNGTVREYDHLEASVSPRVKEKGRADVAATPNGSMNNNQLAMISSGQCSSNLEIASSPYGEVKISLSCNVALERPDFHMPSLEAVLKSVEEKCFSSYKTLDPNFSVMNLMKEFCNCFLKLGSGSPSESPETLNVTQTDDLPNVTLTDDSQLDAEASLPKTSPLPPCNGIDDGSHLKKIDGGDDHRTSAENREDFAENTNDLSLVIAPQPVVAVPPQMIRSLYDIVDITKGREKIVISLVNETSSESPPSFHYITQNVFFLNAFVNFSLARIGDNNCCTCPGDCLSLPTPCACANKTGGKFAYTTEGLVEEEFLEECISMNHNPNKHCQFFCKECPLERSKSDDFSEEPCKGHLVSKFIKECWLSCNCNSQCGNRVVQRGITRNLQVFMTPDGKGWGLRTLEDLPKGAFVSEYVGEVLTNRELFDRVLRSPSREKYSYPVLLDAGWGAKGALKDEEALCLDATHYGNISRFINHRCYDPNLVQIPVELETPDHHYYHLAFFTTREVKALEELTWDYGIDFDDHDHPIKTFRCLCGSKFCRNIKRSRSRMVRS